VNKSAAAGFDRFEGARKAPEARKKIEARLLTLRSQRERSCIIDFAARKKGTRCERDTRGTVADFDKSARAKLRL
jgi:hypothetical protein